MRVIILRIEQQSVIALTFFVFKLVIKTCIKNMSVFYNILFVFYLNLTHTWDDFYFC